MRLLGRVGLIQVLAAMAHHRHNGEILVRPLMAGDAPLVYEAVRSSIDSLSHWFPWCHAGYSFSDAEAWVAHCVTSWQNSTEFPFAIVDSQSGELLGGMGLNRIDSVYRSANLGYWVSEPHRRKGVAIRAAALVAAIGFEDLGFVRLEIVALPHNQASQRVAERLGAIREGQARNKLMFQGQPAIGVVYSLIPSDMAANNSFKPKPLRGSA